MAAFFRLYLRVLKELGNQRRIASLLVLGNLVLAAAQFAEPVLFGRIIDMLTADQARGVKPTFAALGPLVAAWVAFGLSSIGGSVLVALHADRLAQRRRLAVMADYFNHVLHLPQSFHAASHSGRTIKVMNDGASGMAGIWLQFFREHCASFVALLVLLPLSLFINWRLGLLLIVLVVVAGVATNVVMQRTHRLQDSVERYSADLAARTSDALGNIPVIQSFTRIEAETLSMRQVIRALLDAQLPVLSWWALMTVATRASATLTILSIFLLGTWLHIHDQATIGQIVTFMSFATMLIGRLEQVVGFVNQLFMQAPRLRDFFEVLDTRPLVADKPGAVDPGRLHGRVVYEDVGFRYDARRAAVQDLSFSIEAGQTVALVGSTGSGKSTALALLHRVFDPMQGRITIDGIDLRDMPLAALRRNIGVVFQEPMLFARSIEENLRVGDPDATDEEITQALQWAQASEFVARQPDRLGTIVGERGRSLSGGERQRLSIARALLKDPPIMILDEATSALDATTERALQAALDRAMHGRTTFVIAHRLATVRNADTILVFDEGRVVERGTFDELVARGGRFAALAQAQFMAATAEGTRDDAC